MVAALPYCDYDINFAPLEFSGDFTDAIGSSRSPAILDRYSISVDPAEFLQMRGKGGGPRTPYRRVRAEYSDEPLFAWLLRAGDQRPCTSEATREFDELPPLHGLPP